MELRNIGMDDLSLYERIHCDPAMMEHLGGPLPREGLAEKLQRDVASTEAGETWVLKIVPRPGVAAGTVAVWSHDWSGRPISEIGWMVLPEFQGQGLATAAVRAVLRRARAESRWDVLHAFPQVDNAASNAICRKLGFTRVEELEYTFRDRVLRGTHWRIDLRVVGPP